jgi:hypothetical protein
METANGGRRCTFNFDIVALLFTTKQIEASVGTVGVLVVTVQ